MLWPRFELILEMNVQSVRSTDPQRLGGLDTRPHYVRGGEGNWFGKQGSTLGHGVAQGHGHGAAYAASLGEKQRGV